MWIDAKVLENEIAGIMPVVSWAVSKLPGTAGATIAEFLTVITRPTTLEAVVALVNSLTGAKAPTA